MADPMAMTFDDYQQQASKTAIYPNRLSNITYPALGLAGESGEVSEKGISMSAVARMNLEKLASRKQRGVLSGSGDAR